MKIQQAGETLQISEISELSAANSQAFRDRVRATIPAQVKTIEIDLAATSFMDSCGLGALIALYKSYSNSGAGVTIRLVNPTPPVQQLIELTQMHRLFEVEKR
ncbi:MAG: STAS domain-containing protein [Verrucomicrobia bacterium]|nr:STAS domain-containing protein [Verrucomicrobiota bacterium]